MIKLYVNEDFAGNKCDIYLRKKLQGESIFYGYDGKNLIEKIIPDNEFHNVPSLLTIPYWMKDVLIREFTQIANKNGVNTENENLLQGKIKAMEVHLSDMREISKKLLDSKLNDQQRS